MDQYDIIDQYGLPAKLYNGKYVLVDDKQVWPDSNIEKYIKDDSSVNIFLLPNQIITFNDITIITNDNSIVIDCTSQYYFYIFIESIVMIEQSSTLLIIIDPQYRTYFYTSYTTTDRQSTKAYKKI